MGFGRALLAGLSGAALGAATLLMMAAMMGMFGLFLAWPIFSVALAFCALVSAFLGAVATAFSRALSWGTAMLIGAFGTVGGFSAILLFVVLTNQGSGRW